MSKFSIRFKDLRRNMKLTQEELSIKLGISRSTIGMYETGKREPDYDSLTLIADYFNVDTGYLLGSQDVAHIQHDLSNSDEELLSLFNKMNDEGQEKVLSYARDISDNPRYIKSNQSELVEKEA